VLIPRRYETNGKTRVELEYLDYDGTGEQEFYLTYNGMVTDGKDDTYID
jgi:hypothetical protein